MTKPKINELVEIYKSWSKEKLDEEIDALMDIAYAILESQECDSIESFPNPSVKITISCEVIKDGSGKYYN